MPLRHALLPALLLTAPAFADGWGPIPDEVWALKDSPLVRNKDAVFVEARLVLDNRYIEYGYRLRIMSEAGKAAAEQAVLSDKAYDIEGRTVYPDGKVVPFQSRKDFQTKAVVETRRESIERKVIIPPGLSGDCVVELRFKEPFDFGAAAASGLGNMKTWTLAHTYPVSKYTVETSHFLPWSWYMEFPSGQRMQRTETPSRKVITLLNVNALPSVPYVREPLRDAPRIIAYAQPQDLTAIAHQGPDAYWKAVAERWIKPYFQEGISRSGGYKEFSAKLQEGLPKPPQAAASELLLRLEARIRNTSFPTHLEAQVKAESDRKNDPKALGDTVKRGSASSGGMRLLYLALLKDAGIPHQLVFVADGDLREVNKKQPNFEQFHDLLVGIPEEGKPMAWMDPGLRFSPPGLLHPGYQETTAYLVDPATWTPRFEALPVQPAASNRRRYEYRLELEEEGDRFQVEAAFEGHPGLVERHRYLALEPAAQAKQLKETLEARSKQVRISRTEVRNVLDPRQAVAWSAEGVLERESGRRRMVAPFPLLPLPLWVPDAFEERRRESIHLPGLSFQSATSRFKVPAGYRWPEQAALEKANKFGRVTWKPSLEADGSIRVTLETEILASQGSSADYKAFREFLGWTQEAVGLQILLEKTN